MDVQPRHEESDTWHPERQLILGELKQTRRIVSWGAAIVGLLTIISAGVLVVDIQMLKEERVDPDSNIILSQKNKRPLRVQEQLDIIPLHVLNAVPLQSLQKLQTVTLQVAENTTKFYQIHAASRDDYRNATTLFLSLSTTLELTSSTARLIEDGTLLQEWELTTAQQHAAAVDSDDTDETRRRLWAWGARYRAIPYMGPAAAYPVGYAVAVPVYPYTAAAPAYAYPSTPYAAGYYSPAAAAVAQNQDAYGYPVPANGAATAGNAVGYYNQPVRVPP
ncbi:unnamed protein product [Vitrella brassicaformis CCMP3155]|uniref:Uncharacterized protein n=2 Tax=Vitrella brassicaformis TaxID=1169539 RepID=A0A0G4ETQ3_VITBC|nr:unnamed protein product [Vitrella brassicaformis CCMP3155]|eukprot:CEM01190.1 unnamed protein product [Vitrella brassicaformis CCMP3155]